MNRAILLLMLGLSLAPVLCWAADPKAEEAKAIAAIEKLDGSVTFDENSPGRPVIGVNLCGYESPVKAGDAVMEHIKGLNQLRDLDLSGTRVTDAGLSNIKGLSRLQRLVLSTKVTDAGLVNLRELNQLKALGLGWTQVTDAGIVNLRGPTRLQRLVLSQTKVTDKGLVNLKEMNHLQYLFLDHTQIADGGLVYLKGMNQLQELNLEGTKVTDVGLENLTLLSKLKTLSFYKTNVTGTGLRNLTGLNQFRELHLGGAKLTDAGLVHLKGMIQLDSLWINDSPVTDIVVTYLEKLPHIRHLGFWGTEITDEGIRRLRAALPACGIGWRPNRKLVLDCFPERARPLFVGSMPSLAAEKIQGERIAKAIGDPVEVAVVACRALGAMDASWNFVEADQRLALHTGRTVSGEDFLKALRRLRGDHRGELGAARFCFNEGYDMKIPEADRSEWTNYLARTALEYGDDCNKWSIVRRLGKLNDRNIRALLRQIARGEIAKEVTPWTTGNHEPGLRGTAYVGLARQGDESIREEVTKLLAEVPAGPDRAALEVCLALLGDAKFIKANHFRFQSYVIGYAAIQAIEKFGGREGVDVLVKAGIDHPWAAVNKEAALAIQRITGQTWFKNPESEMAWDHSKDIEKWWEEHGANFVEARRSEKR